MGKTLGELEAVNEENIRQDPMENIRRLLGPSGPARGGAICTFQLPGNQDYNILGGDNQVNLYLEAKNSGYTVTLDKSRRELSDDKKERRRLQYDSNNCEGIAVPRPGGYAYHLPANQKIVINPGNLVLHGNAEGYSIVYASSNNRKP